MDSSAKPSPVPLAAFEQLMLADARPGHPMCFYLECVVEGDLDEARLRRAVERTAQRHPLTRSRVGWRSGRPCWLPPDAAPEFVWRPAPGDAPWRPPDLERGSGVRIVVRRFGDGAHGVALVVHHAVCDGIAACEFLGDVWTYYDGGEPRPFTAPAERRARGPAEPGADAAAVAPGERSTVVGETLAFARFLAAPLANVPAGLLPADGGADGGPPFASLELDAGFTARLRAAAQERRATVNDLVLAAVMRAVVEWNDRAGVRRRGIRVTMPVNLRAVRERRPADNAIGYAFLDRTPAECRDREHLTRFLATASQWVVGSGAASRFIETITVVAQWPRLLALVTRLPVCLATVTVSNVGDVGRRMRAGVPRVGGRDAPGGLTIRSFAGVPPLRPGTRAAVGVLGYAEGTTLCCACSAHPDARTGGRAFLELVRQELAGFFGPAA